METDLYFAMSSSKAQEIKNVTKKKCVRFAPNSQVKLVPHYTKYSKKQQKQIWYTQCELDYIRENFEMDLILKEFFAEKQMNKRNNNKRSSVESGNSSSRSSVSSTSSISSPRGRVGDRRSSVLSQYSDNNDNNSDSLRRSSTISSPADNYKFKKVKRISNYGRIMKIMGSKESLLLNHDDDYDEQQEEEDFCPSDNMSSSSLSSSTQRRDSVSLSPMRGRNTSPPSSPTVPPRPRPNNLLCRVSGSLNVTNPKLARSLSPEDRTTTRRRSRRGSLPKQTATTAILMV